MPGDTPPLCERCLKPARDEIHGPVETCRENGRGGCNEPKAHHAFQPARTAPAPLAFDAALAALDVEPTHHTDRMVTTYDILGLDAVRAAHRAEVERAVREAVEQERDACAKAADAEAARMRGMVDGEVMATKYRAHYADGADTVAFKIRARGAKS